MALSAEERRARNLAVKLREYATDPPKFRARIKAARVANPERIRERERQYYAAHRATRLAQKRIARRRRYRENPEPAKASAKRHRLKNPHKVAENNARRRAKQLGAPCIEKISRSEIYARDGGLCAICGEYVPHGCFTLDHVTPLSKGGNHTYDNLVVAHQGCNSSKGNGNTPTQRPLFARLPISAPRA